MNNLAKLIGQRIRNYRTAQKLSQEELGEMAGCHPTYVGQIERGEKNATLESIEKIASALNVSLSQLFEKLGEGEKKDSVPLKCYEFVAEKSPAEQEQLYRMLLAMDEYRKQ